MLRDFYSKLYRIYLTVSKLYKANHFKPLSQLKLLGEFAKIWFGKNFPVAVICFALFLQCTVGWLVGCVEA